MKTKEKIIEKIIELQSDERLSCPIATIDENAPLALIQLELETKIKTLKWTLEGIPACTITNENI